MSHLNRREFVKFSSASGFFILAGAAGAKSASGNAVPSSIPQSVASDMPESIPYDRLSREFLAPPDSARPWVYWFFLDGNLTREGVTADLEAMKAAGIGGVLIMEVAQGTPPGPVRFGSPEWRTMFGFICSEAARLGLEINMTNDAGWCGSGGPWITPELSMQRLVWTSTGVNGGRKVDVMLSQPAQTDGYYQDVAVIAFPTPTAATHGQLYSIPDLAGVTEVVTQDDIAAQATWPRLAAGEIVKFNQVVDLTTHTNAYGRLLWNAPAGNWTILRFGHTSTGVDNHPAPAGGLGLETDKLSKRATTFHFDNLMAKLIAKAGPLAGGTLVCTHIDSWETGSQNWTRTFPDDFKTRRGYDLHRWLPVMTGQVVASLEESERFLWDLRKTISELLVENYSVCMRNLAEKNGLRLSIEGYSGVPVDEMHYGGTAVEPMSELWSWGRFGAAYSVTEMTSAGHVYGRRIIGQETFTADSNERWQGHPAVVKDIGDWAFCQGVNRFVVHRYAMQPFLNIAPGVSMGPWGLHYERTQTWWKQSLSWHQYVARCQHLLRQGHWVADVLYVQPEGAPSGCPTMPGAGDQSYVHTYKCDGCPAEAVISRLRVQNGNLVLPDGMAYRIMVLPDSPCMTVDLLTKIKALADAGATMIGATRPMKSPGLSGYPACDQKVSSLADKIWSSGRIITHKTPQQVLHEKNIPPDFTSDSQLHFAHRRTDDADIYFVTNLAENAVDANCAFRITGRTPELWNPQTGAIEPAAIWTQDADRKVTHVSLRLEWKESTFVVFSRPARNKGGITRITRNDTPLFGYPTRASAIHILHATYGPADDPARTRVVTAIVASLFHEGHTSFPVVQIAQIGGDPAFNVVKTLLIDVLIDGKKRQLRFLDGQTANLLTSVAAPLSVDITPVSGKHLSATVFAPGHYGFFSTGGAVRHARVASLPKPLELSAPWTVRFPPDRGAPAQVVLPKLISLSEHPVAGVKYFSGTAEYSTEFRLPPRMLSGHRRHFLDLGRVAVMAEVSLNGHRLDLLWKPPWQMDITGLLMPDRNTLSVKVTNLWINRMIGDEFLPEDSDRNPDGTLRQWPDWVLEGKKSPTGRISFTTWRLWHKNDQLVESGLLGPVTIRTAQIVVLA